MRPQLARFTEWAWMNGRLETRAHMDDVAALFLDWLAQQHPGAKGSTEEALTAIRTDMQRTWRALAYGGRQNAEIPLERKTSLKREALQLGWSL